MTPRGALARAINGYELQVTELLFQGALERLEPDTLAVVFVALVYEERRRNVGGWHAGGPACEAEYGTPTPLR